MTSGRAHEQRRADQSARHPGGSAGSRVLLAGRTAALQWAALHLRHAGFEPVELQPGPAPPSHDAVALLADLDDEEWSGLRELASDVSCPVVLLSAFGSEADAPSGSDLTVSAAGGLLDVSGTPAEEDGRPSVLSPHQADALAGAFAALWVGALSLSGARTGTLELSKLECVGIACSWAAMQWIYAGNIPSRFGDSPFQPSGLFEDVTVPSMISVRVAAGTRVRVIAVLMRANATSSSVSIRLSSRCDIAPNTSALQLAERASQPLNTCAGMKATSTSSSTCARTGKSRLPMIESAESTQHSPGPNR